MFEALPPPQRRRKYWIWTGGVLYLLITVDMITTIWATELHGPGAEVNPLVRWAVQHGVVTLAGINLAALFVLGILFHWMIELTIEAPERYQPTIALAFEVWIALLLAAGIAVFANNLSVIVLGESLSLTLVWK